MRYLACIIGIIAVMLLAIPVFASSIDLNHISPEQKYSILADLSGVNTFEINVSYSMSPVYTVYENTLEIDIIDYYGSHIVHLSFHGNGTTTVSIATQPDNGGFNHYTVQSWNTTSMYRIIYNRTTKNIVIYADTVVVVNTTLSWTPDFGSLAGVEQCWIEVIEFGIEGVPTDSNMWSGSLTINGNYAVLREYYVYLGSSTSSSSSSSESSSTLTDNSVQETIEQTKETIQNTVTTAVPPLMSLGVLLLGLKKIEEILSSLMR